MTAFQREKRSPSIPGFQTARSFCSRRRGKRRKNALKYHNRNIFEEPDTAGRKQPSADAAVMQCAGKKEYDAADEAASVFRASEIVKGMRINDEKLTMYLQRLIENNQRN